MNIKKTAVILLILHLSFFLHAQQKKNIYIPDIPGYKTLKCDFHTHTVFSDGLVWPTVRIAEAWLEGLDALAISEHIEYRPHSTDINADHNRAYEIAKPIADRQGIILVKAAEITRQMPPGHLNVLFIENANLLERDGVFEALQEAKDQGAFIFWNHPGWKSQQPDTTLWWDEHTQLLEKGLMNGIEVYNSNEYYPEALDWANEKKLTILCNTDLHVPVQMAYNLSESHRPMTLVFANGKTEEALKEALFAGRTLAWFDHTLMGSAELLEPLFFACVELENNKVNLKNKEVATLSIKNTSDVDYRLELAQPTVAFSCPEKIYLKAHNTTRIELTGNSEEISNIKTLNMYFLVTNAFTHRYTNLVVNLKVEN
jgi:3',5'-nucleoside bisphosphate phosphatase